jgi:hypothetical protein
VAEPVGDYFIGIVHPRNSWVIWWMGYRWLALKFWWSTRRFWRFDGYGYKFSIWWSDRPWPHKILEKTILKEK